MKLAVYLFLALTLGLVQSCKKEVVNAGPSASQSTSQNKIMPLGASRVEGAPPSFESYRYELWKLLKDGGYDFDFVGTEADSYSYGQYNGQTFDADHEGRGGITAAEIRNGLPGWLDQGGIPDIVLFSSPGGNDLLGGANYQDVLVDVNAIIDILQSYNPNVTILIEQMAPSDAATMTQQFTAIYNTVLQEIGNIAQQQTTTTSSVMVVNMSTGFDANQFLADDVHYNQAGASFIANQYYQVLQGVLQ